MGVVSAQTTTGFPVALPIISLLLVLSATVVIVMLARRSRR